MTTSTTKSTDRFVRVGNLNLHYLEWGQAGAPPVIMVHGLSGNAHAFDNLAPHFLPMYHVIAVDVRGRGDSDWAGDADYSNDAYVADLEGLRQALGFERISLVGTSLGGRISMTYAGAYPDRVERTALNDIGPQIDPRGGDRIAVSTREAVTSFASMDEVLAWHAQLRPGFNLLSDTEQRVTAGHAVKTPVRRRLYLEDGPGSPNRPPTSRPGDILDSRQTNSRPSIAGQGRRQRPALAGDCPANGPGNAGLPNGRSTRGRPCTNFVGAGGPERSQGIVRPSLNIPA